MRFLWGGMAGVVRKGRKIKKTRLSARDGTYMIFGESVLGKLAMTFLMAMVPVVELRGAIPMGVAAGLPPAVAAVTAMALRVPFSVSMAAQSETGSRFFITRRRHRAESCR